MRIAAIYRRHFRDVHRERMFLSSVGFFLTFATVRGITHAIRAGKGPFHNINRGSTHIHHLVFGILLLLLTGFLWLIEVGTAVRNHSRRASRITATLFGVGSALTLDEFALWLNLEDVYWARQGRESIDAVVLFGSLLSVSFWGRWFFRELAAEAARAWNDTFRRLYRRLVPSPGRP